MEKDKNVTLRGLRECNKIIETIIKKKDVSSIQEVTLSMLSFQVLCLQLTQQFQKQIKDQKEKDTKVIKLEYRIGINMGDVVKEDEKLLGDGVNIAERLDALAQSGDITISKNIYDLVGNNTKYEFNDLGIQKVKENQFHACNLLLDPS